MLSHPRSPIGAAIRAGVRLLPVGLICGCVGHDHQPGAKALSGPSSGTTVEAVGAPREGEVAAQQPGPGQASTGVATTGVASKQDDKAKAGVTAAADPTRLPISGMLNARYVGRTAGGEHDHDLYSMLSVDVGDPERNDLTAHVMGRGAWDLDGRGDRSTFFSINDTYDDRVTGRLYDAYVDAGKLTGLGILRGGRQMIWDTPETLWFDGIRAETKELTAGRLQFGAYGGMSAHIYEASNDGDWTAGAYAQARPWQGGRARLDWTHLEDKRRAVERDDDLLAAGLWQNFGAGWDAQAQYSRFADRDRDVRGRLDYHDAERDFRAHASYYQLLATERDLVLELDPFFSSLRDYYPFQQYGLSAAKGLWKVVEVQGGADLRHVADSADEGQFNRDYDRYFLSLGLTDTPWPGLSLRGTGDVWHSDGQIVRSFSGEISQRVREALTVSVGTYYSLYKFDLYLNQERDHVRSYFADVRYRASAASTFTAALRYEDDDFDDYLELRLGVTWRF